MFQQLLRRQWLVVAVLFCAGLGRSGVQAAPPLRLRVLTYNIHHGEGVDRRLDLPRIAAVIGGAEPDIVALQECDRGMTRSHGVDQPQRLAELTGMKAVFGPNIRLQGGDYGNALLTRFPILRRQNHLLPNVDEGEQRGVLEVELDCGEGRRLIVWATHLDHRTPDRERFESAQRIQSLAAEHGQAPMILAGDLNAVPDSRVLEEFRKAWRAPNDRPLPTIPVRQPARQIDYVLLSTASPWMVRETRVLEEAVASDHRALLLDVALP
jgi:endonuclease/exonuclease/phosphatase family metal-dependent hydrolase